MKYFVNSTGEIFGYDSIEQAAKIKSLDLNVFSPLSKLPKATEKWDAASKSFKADLTLEKTLKKAQIESDYQTALDAGVTYSGALFQSDAKSIATLSETLTAVANGWTLPTGFAWIDAANTAHPANAVFLKGLSTAIKAAKTVTAVNKVAL